MVFDFHWTFGYGIMIHFFRDKQQIISKLIRNKNYLRVFFFETVWRVVVVRKKIQGMRRDKNKETHATNHFGHEFRLLFVFEWTTRQILKRMRRTGYADLGQAQNFALLFAFFAAGIQNLPDHIFRNGLSIEYAFDMFFYNLKVMFVHVFFLEKRLEKKIEKKIEKIIKNNEKKMKKKFYI